MLAKGGMKGMKGKFPFPISIEETYRNYYPKMFLFILNLEPTSNVDVLKEDLSGDENK